MKNLDRPWAAFQPPSDMNAGGGGGSSTSKKIFIGLGIGCGVVLLIVGILFAAGAFKAVSCCNQFKGIAEKSMGAEQFGNRFAQNVWEGELDDAYAQTSEAFQSEVSRDAFETLVEAHREPMEANAPRLFNMQLEQENAQRPSSLEEIAEASWQMSYQFAGPKDEKMLLLKFTVDSVGEGADAKFVASSVRFDEETRKLWQEPPAREVLRIHDMLQRGQYELAYGQLGDEFRTETDREAWRQFLDDAGPILTQSDLEIREVAYDASNTQATVMAHAHSKGGRDGLIQFELVPMPQQLPGFGWRIVTIAPLVAETVTHGPSDPVPPMPSGTNTATEGSTGGETGTHGEAATNGREPAVPEVEADFD